MLYAQSPPLCAHPTLTFFYGATHFCSGIQLLWPSQRIPSHLRLPCIDLLLQAEWWEPSLYPPPRLLQQLCGARVLEVLAAIASFHIYEAITAATAGTWGPAELLWQPARDLKMVATTHAASSWQTWGGWRGKLRYEICTGTEFPLLISVRSRDIALSFACGSGGATTTALWQQPMKNPSGSIPSNREARDPSADGAGGVQQQDKMS